MFQRSRFALLSALAFVLLSAPGLAAQETQSATSGGTTLRGTVHDHSGKPVEDAHVVLQEVSSQTSRDTSTGTAGGFTFAGVSRGTFTVTANSGPLGSAAVSVTVSTTGEQPGIDLILDASAARQSGSAPDGAAQAMQFADKPDFAIAAVTDWTAAGGHGSDASLRTSEALTREAVKLGTHGAQPAATGSASAGSDASESDSTLRAGMEKKSNDFEANRRLGLLHRGQGELDEKRGDPLAAVHEFQQAAREDPSEDNYFAWGSELLVHRAIWQAREVFDEGVRLYPQSARMLTARGASLFAGALYDEAATDLCKASDLNPESVEPYLFIGKIETAAPNPLACVLAKLTMFQRLQPTNSLANYYYAMVLWKPRGDATDARTTERVKALLTRAVTLDPKCADAYFELGNLSAGQKQWKHAITYYLNAIQANPELNEAHYRLAVAYAHAGEKAQAREQFQLHTALAAEQASEIENQRKTVKQFMVVLTDQTGKQQSR
jgi:tetratricopeptide (TPR) repeat protein